MSTELGRGPERRKPSKTKAPEKGQSGQPRAKRAQTEPSGERRAAARKNRKIVRRVGRTLRAGGATTVLYTKKAVYMFNAFTHSPGTSPDSTPTPLRRVVRFFQTMTFPMFLVLSLLVVLVSVMAFSNSTITIDRQKIYIVGLPKELEGYTILHLGDLHGREFGAKQSVLLRVINQESYNLCVFTGDMVGASGNAQPFYDLLEGLTANRQRYFIAGDSDPEPVLRQVRDITGTLEQMVLSDWVLGAQQRGATYLTHTTPIKVSGQTLWISPVNVLGINVTETVKQLEEQLKLETAGVVSGLDVDRNNLPMTNYRYDQMLQTQKSSASMQPSDIHLALSHFPPTQTYMTVAQQLGSEATSAYLPVVDLVLAGHYCGGVWKLPGIGALYIPNSQYARHGWFPAKTDVQGAKSLGQATLYTTAGLGVTDKVLLPNFRLMNPPQVSLITLTAAVTDNLLGE